MKTKEKTRNYISSSSEDDEEYDDYDERREEDKESINSSLINGLNSKQRGRKKIQ